MAVDTNVLSSQFVIVGEGRRPKWPDNEELIKEDVREVHRRLKQIFGAATFALVQATSTNGFKPEVTTGCRLDTNSKSCVDWSRQGEIWINCERGGLIWIGSVIDGTVLFSFFNNKVEIVYDRLPDRRTWTVMRIQTD